MSSVHFIFLVCSHNNGKIQTSMRYVPIGVRRVSRRFDIFGLRHVPVSLSYILDCGTSSCRFPIFWIAAIHCRFNFAPRLVLHYIRMFINAWFPVEPGIPTRHPSERKHFIKNDSYLTNIWIRNIL